MLLNRINHFDRLIKFVIQMNAKKMIINQAYQRCKVTLGAVLILQFVYLTILTEPKLQYLVAYFLIGTSAAIMLMVLGRNLSRVYVKPFKSRVFKYLFLISTLAVIFLSRIDYIHSTASDGLLSTRSNDSLGQGGWFSILTALFYPMSMISVFYIRKFSGYYLFLILTLLVAAVDLFALGTRNSVFFVLFFHAIFFQGKFQKYGSASSIWLTLLFFSIVVLIFEYTTRVRSGFVGSPGDYWLEKSTQSEVLGLSIVNMPLFEFFNHYFWFALPIFYLISYISHSIPEFVNFMADYPGGLSPTFAHLYDYFLMLTFQDRIAAIELIERMHVRSGYYQTIYASLIVDFGGLLLAFPIAYIALCRLHCFLIVQMYILPVICFATIDNYFYTGLTPIRAALFVLLSLLFIRKQFVVNKLKSC